MKTGSYGFSGGEGFKDFNRDVRGFKERCDFYTGNGITFQLLMGNILK